MLSPACSFSLHVSFGGTRIYLLAFQGGKQGFFSLHSVLKEVSGAPWLSLDVPINLDRATWKSVPKFSGSNANSSLWVVSQKPFCHSAVKVGCLRWERKTGAWDIRRTLHKMTCDRLEYRELTANNQDQFSFNSMFYFQTTYLAWFSLTLRHVSRWHFSGYKAK